MEVPIDYFPGQNDLNNINNNYIIDEGNIITETLPENKQISIEEYTSNSISNQNQVMPIEEYAYTSELNQNQPISYEEYTPQQNENIGEYTEYTHHNQSQLLPNEEYKDIYQQNQNFEEFNDYSQNLNIEEYTATLPNHNNIGEYAEYSQKNLNMEEYPSSSSQLNQNNIEKYVSSSSPQNYSIEEYPSSSPQNQINEEYEFSPRNYTVEDYISSQPNQNMPISIKEYATAEQNLNQPISIDEYNPTSIVNINHKVTSQLNNNPQLSVEEYPVTSKQTQNQQISIEEYPATLQPNQAQQITVEAKKEITQPNQSQQIGVEEYPVTSQPSHNQSQRLSNNSQQSKSQSVSIAPNEASPQINASKQENIKSTLTEPLMIKDLNINQSMASKSSYSERVDESIVTQPRDTPMSFAQSIIFQLNKTQPIMHKNISQQEIDAKKSLMGRIPGAMPVYKLIRQGVGINPTEQQGIIFCAMKAYQEGIIPLSNNTARLIKTKLGGDWLVIVYEEGKSIDFNMTHIEGSDFMYFVLDRIAYQVCRLR
jgi:hypothetical protein